MEELEKQIEALKAEMTVIQSKLKVLRDKRKAIQDEIPRCRNCKNCMVTINQHGYRGDWKCSVSITKYGRPRIVAKSLPACDKYEHGQIQELHIK